MKKNVIIIYIILIVIFPNDVSAATNINGYVITNYHINCFTYLLFIIPLSCLLISLYLWYKYGRDKQVIEPIEFYPPDNYNSLEFGYLYKGKANVEDVTSLLIYLANKGYIKIIEVEGKYKKSFKFVKLKEYDDNNEYEKVFFEGLFKNKNSDNKENVVETITESDLKNKFYKTINKILSNINTLNNRCGLFEISADNKTIYVIFMIIISLLTVIAVPMFDYSDLNTFISSIIISFCCISVFKILNFRQLSLIFRIIYGFIFFSTFTIFLITNFITGSLEFLYLISVIIGNICIVGMLLCLKYMPKRTKYGTQILGRIKGFKIFLETAENEKLESMVFNEPNYFYNILPYAYVLGISEKWIRKFETISLNSPNWYIGTSKFNLNSFISFVNKTMESVSIAKLSNSSSDSEE